MAYVVSGLREGISGRDLSVLVRDTAVLAGFGLVAYPLTTLSAHRAGVWSIPRLHPEVAL